MSLQASFNSWEGILSKCLLDLKNMYPKYTDFQMAQKLDIPRATYNRIKNSKNTVPRIDNIIKLLIASNNMDLLSNGVSLVDENLGEKLEIALDVSMKEKNKKFVSVELEQVFEDRDLFVTYLLSSNKHGSSLEIVKDVIKSIITKLRNLIFLK